MKYNKEASNLTRGFIFTFPPPPQAVRLMYHTKEVFKKTAKTFGIMDDFKSGVPRTAYR